MHVLGQQPLDIMGQHPLGLVGPLLVPPPPMSIEQLLATQNELMHHGVRQPHHQLEMDSSYTDSQATHPPMFAEASIPLEADN
jgi:hypothetical protein